MHGIFNLDKDFIGPTNAEHPQNSPAETAGVEAVQLKPAGATSEVGDLLLDFEPISLEETNNRAQMLSRIDNKYVVNFNQFRAFLKVAEKDFDVLEIEGLRQFTYASCYYDDQFGCYYDHHQGRRRRFKVRTREYVDTGSKYFEFKLKGLRGSTDKHRTSCDYLVTPIIEGEHLEMLSETYKRLYRTEMPYDLRPALMVGYKRSTLVAHAGGERVTIDYKLNFALPGDTKTPIESGKNFIIIETKSADGKGKADRTLKKLKIRKISRCSKYCIGVNLVGAVSKNNRFLPTLKQILQILVDANDLSIVDDGKSNPDTLRQARRYE